MNKEKTLNKLNDKLKKFYLKYNELDFIKKSNENETALKARMDNRESYISKYYNKYNSLELKPYFIPSDYYDKRLSNFDEIWKEWSCIKDYLKNKYKSCFYCKTKSDDMHCHEDWFFNYTDNKNIIHLNKILYVCNDCHNVVHIDKIFNGVKKKYKDIKEQVNNYSDQEFKSKVKDLKQEIKKTDKKIKDAINKFNEVNNTNNISLKNTILVAFKNCSSLSNYNDEQKFKYDKESFIKSLNRIDEKTCKNIMNNEKVKEEFNF